MSCFALVVVLFSGAAALASEPFDDQMLPERATKVSDHVWVISGFPNVALVVGDRTTLVVDTGLGKRNGAIVAKVARKLAPRNRLALTTTHFHPEHASGAAGFPAETWLVRNRVQQDEMTQHGHELIRIFEGLSPFWRSLLVDVGAPRSPDVIFERELTIDLGGVTAKLLWLGPAHTKGDTLVFVPADKTLISGDIVQNKVGPFIYGEGGTATSWIAVLDEVAKLDSLHVVPDHSPVGDGSLIAEERSFLVELRDRARELQRRGVSAEQAGRELTAELKAKYPEWRIGDLTSFVTSVYGG